MLPAWAGRGLRRSYNGPMTEFAAALLYALAWSVARLPWPLLRALADGVAALSIAVNAREARVARRNLELIRPDLDGAAREALMRDILRTTARQAFETLRLWTRPAARNLAEIAEVHGEARFDAALLEPRGLLVAAPHMGNWELLNQWLAAKTPLAILYRPPESAIGEAFLRRVRANADVARALALRSGDAVMQARRILSFAGVPTILEDIWLPGQAFKGLTAEQLANYQGPTYAMFELDFGVRMVRAEEKIRAVLPDEEQAHLLQITPVTPLLSVERIAYTYNDVPMELRRGLYRTDTHHYRNELS